MACFMHATKAISEGHPHYAHAQQVSGGPASSAAAGVGVVEYSSIIIGPCTLIDPEAFLWLSILIANSTTAEHGMYHHFGF